MNKEKVTLKKIKEVCQRPGFHNCWFRQLSYILSVPVLKFDITPTQITWVSVILGIVAGFFFYPGQYIWSLIGTLVTTFAFLLDHIDGNIARYKQIFSDRGYFLDEVGSYLGIPL